MVSYRLDIWPFFYGKFPPISNLLQVFGAGTEVATVKALQDRGYEVWWGGGHVTGRRDTLMVPA